MADEEVVEKKTAVKKAATKKAAVKKTAVKKTAAKKTAAKKTAAPVVDTDKAAAKKAAAPKKVAAAKSDTAVKRLSVTLVRSKHGRLVAHKACVAGLGLRRMHQTVQVIDTPENRGMINRIHYMLKVEDA
jgi:large subunit ribosomal protein L30